MGRKGKKKQHLDLAAIDGGEIAFAGSVQIQDSTKSKGSDVVEGLDDAADACFGKRISEFRRGDDGIASIGEFGKKTTAPIPRDSARTTTGSNNMAISLTKYVDIRSAFPSDGLVQRSFGGLVFTTTEMLSETTASSEKTTYDAGEAVALTLSTVKQKFGEDSNEAKFATRYYSYVSPNGNVPTALRFAKVLPRTIDVFSSTKTYAVDDYVKHTEVSTEKTYKCKIAITTPGDWDASKWDEVTTTVYEKASTALVRIDAMNNQFGSFTFLDTVSSAGAATHTFPSDELVEAAATNNGFSVRYLFVVNDIRGTQLASAVVDKKEAYGDANAGLAFVSGYDNCSAAMPMAILAATDFTSSVTNYMFKQFPYETPSVLGDNDYDTFKDGNVNFYGRTKSNGTLLDFYQRGFNTDGTETAIYCNEMWFKSVCATNLISTLISSERIPANSTGVQIVEGIVLDVCSTAASSGAFMSKAVSTASATQIRNLISSVGGTTEDSSAIIDNITTNGYSVYAYLGNDYSGDYIIHYFVFYGTADSIRFIKGDDVMVK